MVPHCLRLHCSWCPLYLCCKQFAVILILHSVTHWIGLVHPRCGSDSAERWEISAPAKNWTLPVLTWFTLPVWCTTYCTLEIFCCMSLLTYLAGDLLYIHVTYGIFIYNVEFILIIYMTGMTWFVLNSCRAFMVHIALKSLPMGTYPAECKCSLQSEYQALLDWSEWRDGDNNATTTTATNYKS